MDHCGPIARTPASRKLLIAIDILPGPDPLGSRMYPDCRLFVTPPHGQPRATNCDTPGTECNNPGMTAALDPQFVEREYNNRALVPEHPAFFARWDRDSEFV